MKNIYVIRHCKADGQAPNAGLTETGVRQAEELAAAFMDKKIDCILSSPYERAVRTIKPLADQLGIEVELDHRLAERVLSSENHPEWLDRLRYTYDDLDLCYEGGESSNTAMSRAVRVVKEALTRENKNMIVVSHGNLISLLLKHFDNRIGFEEWQALSNPDVFHLAFSGDTPVIRRIWAE